MQTRAVDALEAEAAECAAILSVTADAELGKWMRLSKELIAAIEQGKQLQAAMRGGAVAPLAAAVEAAQGAAQMDKLLVRSATARLRDLEEATRQLTRALSSADAEVITAALESAVSDVGLRDEPLQAEAKHRLAQLSGEASPVPSNRCALAHRFGGACTMERENPPSCID